jgi:hypothetical protein
MALVRQDDPAPRRWNQPIAVGATVAGGAHA